MNRSSVTVKLGRVIQKLPLSLFRILEYPIIKIKNPESKQDFTIILLALPRSGSTLTYQVLCHGLRVNYLSNIGNLLYQLPLIGGILSNWKCHHHLSDFSSQHGFVSGLCSPAEGLRYWNYWFNNSIDDRILIKKSQKKINHRMKYLTKVFAILGKKDKPFVTGYLGHVLKHQELREVFPSAIFIRLHRDPLCNALSLLKSRKIKADWFSVFPNECQQYLNETPYKQVAAQVYWLNKRLEKLENDHLTIHVYYEKLCQSPKEELSKIVSFCKKQGFNISSKYKLPEFFHTNTINHDNETHLVRIALETLEAKYGKIK